MANITSAPLVYLTFSWGTWMGREVNFQGGGVPPVMASVGAFTGFYVVRRERREVRRVA